MKRLEKGPICLILVFLLIGLLPASVIAANKPLSVEVEGGSAAVTFVEGRVTVVKEGMVKEQPLSKGDILSKGDRIQTAKGARVELKLPDKSYMRFDELTTFTLIESAYDKKKKSRNIKVSMIFGKTWARVSKLFGGRGNFSIQTKTAVAGVRGTVYRMNVNQDDSAMVKVYDGEVNVSKLQKDQVSASPGPILKPTPVPGPHPISMEEWTYIVKSLQQINISPDGSAVKPFRFDIKADLNDWVRWNQMRDSATDEEQ